MKRLLPLIALLCATNIYAQNYLGLRQSNYSGILGADLNPSTIVDNRYQFHMTVVGANVDFYNTYFSSDVGMLGSMNAFSDSTFFDNHISQNTSQDIHSVYLNNEINGPSFLVSLSDVSALGFTYKLRTYFNLDGVGTPIAQLGLEELKYEDLWRIRIQNESLSLQTMSWAEYGANYARVVYDENEHYIKVGARMKLLQGIQAAYLFVDDLEYEFTNNDTLSLFESDIDYGHSTNYDVGDENIKYRFESNPGVGIDIGVEYEWRPDWEEYKYKMDGRDDIWRADKNKYKLKAGFSVLDIGRIKFTKGQYSRNFHADIDDWDISNLGIESVYTFDSIINTTFSYLGGDVGEFKMNLPTTIVLNADYHIWQDFYANGMAYMAFQFNKDKNKVHNFSNYTLTPRFDHKHFGVSAPLSYSNMAGFRMGLGLRAGPIAFGTGNLFGFIGSGNNYGADAYFIASIPVYKKIPKDKDGDFVSNPFDDCPDVKGVWEFRGCPDTDNDRIPDTSDECPAEAGLIEFNGCPDTDRDGIKDSDDECPTIAGTLEMKGCPDTDGDGVKDSEDKCPTVPGVQEFAGCPDTDGDGIMDRADNCPTEPGPLHNYGCPDNVRLHLVDEYGNVVATAVKGEDGFVFKKIPTDRSYMFLLEGEDEEFPAQLYITIDNDGEKTKILALLNETTGYFEYKHIDSIDEELVILEAEEEAVLLAREEKEILQTAFDHLEFETGKAIIADGSYESLNNLVELLLKKTDWKLSVEGHTDNVGKAASNLILSKKRAEAVKFYLVQRGVGESRVVVKYFGQSKPIADNETEEGRQKNRRVEMEVIK